MVVDLTIDSECRSSHRVQQGLSAAGNIHDGEAFVGEHGTLVLEHPGPIGPAVTLPFGDGKCCCTKFIGRSIGVQNRCNRTHGIFFFALPTDEAGQMLRFGPSNSPAG